MKKLIKEKHDLEKRLHDVNNQIKQLNYKKMLEIEKSKGLEVGCLVNIKIDGYASNKYFKYLGIKDPYPFGNYQVLIEYQLQGCQVHTLYISDINEVIKL